LQAVLVRLVFLLDWGTATRSRYCCWSSSLDAMQESYEATAESETVSWDQLLLPLHSRTKQLDNSHEHMSPPRHGIVEEDFRCLPFDPAAAAAFATSLYDIWTPNTRRDETRRDETRTRLVLTSAIGQVLLLLLLLLLLLHSCLLLLPLPRAQSIAALARTVWRQQLHRTRLLPQQQRYKMMAGIL
jgi:hypothetical protein